MSITMRGASVAPLGQKQESSLCGVRGRPAGKRLKGIGRVVSQRVVLEGCSRAGWSAALGCHGWQADERVISRWAMVSRLM
jgi:hypothetical protein